MASATSALATNGLAVDALTVAYGGAMAVDNLSLRAPLRQVTGLIGPNGAGKTTTFNACCGLLNPRSGSVSYDGTEITSLPPQARAQMGIGRTFQRMELCDSLSVHDNVALGRESRLAGRWPLRHLLGSRHDRDVVRSAADDAIELCGLPAIRDVPARSLSTGTRRLVELARAVAGGFDMLLLDEPSSGLDGRETERFAEILVQLVDDRGVGILLVEHDMSLVMSVCANLFVLDFGALIFEGSATAAQASPIVRSAYLGEMA